MRQFQSAVLIIAMASVLGCSQRPAPEPAARPASGTTRFEANGRTVELSATSDLYIARHTVTAPATTVLRILPSILTELGIPIARVDSTTMTVEFRQFATRRRLGETPLTRYLDCGSQAGMPNANSYTVTISGWTKVERNASGATEVLVHVTASAKPEGVMSQTVVCSSNGRLESQIADLVRDRVGLSR